MSGQGPLVHLVDPSGPGGSRWLASLASRHAQGVFVALGGAPSVPCAHRVPVVASRSVTARTLERLLETLQAGAVVAWGHRAAAMATQARDAARRWLVLDAVPTRCPIPFDAQVLCVSEAVAHAASLAKWPPMRLSVQQLPSPLAAVWDADGSLRSAHRERWGASPSAIVVGLLPAGPGEGDAMTALDVVGRAHLAGIDARLVLHPGTGGAGDMQVFARRAGLRDRVGFEEGLESPESMASAVDVWLSLPDPARDGTALDASAIGGLSGCLLASAGSLAAAEIEPDVDGVVAEGCNALAAALVTLAETPSQRSAIGLAARARHGTEGRAQSLREALAEIETEAGIRAANPSAAPA